MTIKESPDVDRETGVNHSSTMYRLIYEGLRVVPQERRFLHPTRSELAQLIYPRRSDAEVLLSKLAGRIGAELENPRSNPSINTKLTDILSASDFAGMPSMGVVAILRRNIGYDEAEMSAQRARRRSSSHAPSQAQLTTETPYRQILAEEMLKAARAVAPASSEPEIRPESARPKQEAVKDPRTLTDAHLYRLLDFFSHMTTASKEFFGMGIPRFGQTRMLEVMQRIKEEDPSIDDKAKAASLELPQILRDFPLDKSEGSQAKRQQFLAANEDMLARNLLGVLAISKKPETYELLLSNLPIQ